MSPRSGGFETLAGARSSTTERRCVVSTIRSLRSLLDHLSRRRPSGASEWFRVRSPALAPQPPKNRDGPANQNPATATTGSRAERPEAERRRRDATATPRLRQPRLLDNSDQPTGQITWFRDARWRSLLNHRRALCGLDYPLASLAARPPFTSRPSGASEWFRCARRGSLLNHRRTVTDPRTRTSDRNHRIWSRATGSRTKASGRHRNPTPTGTTTLDISDQPTDQITWFRDARWRSLLNHRRACVVSTIRSLRSLLDHR